MVLRYLALRLQLVIPPATNHRSVEATLVLKETSLRLLAICNVKAVKDGFGPRTCPPAKSEFSVQP